MRSRFALFLLPTVYQAVLTFATLPLATAVLDPSDYGAYAIVASLAGLGVAISTSAAGMLLPAHYPSMNSADRAELIRALLLAAGVTIVVFALGLIGLLSAAPRLVAGGVSKRGVMLATAAMVLSTPWSIAYLVIILEGRAGIYAATLLISATTSAAVLIASLYLLDLGRDALFVSYVATAIVMFVSGTLVLKPYLALGASATGKWMRRILRLALISGVTNVLENVQTFAERAVLARFVGLHDVGVYSHSQVYKGAVFGTLKAASNSLWPRSLEEARDHRLIFATTKRAWQFIYVNLILAGVFASFLGDDLAALLTHGKFRQAGPLIAGLVIVLLLQFSGKPQLALLYAKDEGEYLGRLMGFAAGVAIASLWWTVPLYGVWGAVLALAIQQLVFRAGIHLRSSRHGSTPFQDGDVVGGVLLIGACIWVEKKFEPGTLIDASAAVSLAVTILTVRWQAIRLALSYILGSRPASQREGHG